MRPIGMHPRDADTLQHATVESTDEGLASIENGTIYKATSVAEIKATLAKLHEQEQSVTMRLNHLVASQKEFSRGFGKLDLMRANLGSQAVTTRSFSNDMLSGAASTARRISGAVQRLDLEQARVRATLDVVEQVSELKACVLGVTGSMGAPQDWETAAGYLHRASKIPREIIDGSFAEEIVPSAEVPDLPRETLDNAAESLCGLFLREFEKAAEEGNGAKVTRFFKLFPLIGRSDVGLDVYGRYVCQGVSSRARANLNAGTGGNQSKDGFFYANALTKLFEHIAQIVEHHGGLVERHYGQGRMVRVIERLQTEADIQGGIIIDTWSDERRIDRKLTDIKSYAFTFLVQSFLPTPITKGPTARSGSPAPWDTTHDRQSSEDDSTDMKDVDGLVSEMAIMLGRWSLYSRFLASKCKDPNSNDEEKLMIPSLIMNSNLMRKITDRLVSPCNVMTTFYFRRSVEKAFQLDEQPPDLSLNPNKPIPSNPPYMTSAVDDVMYIVDQVIHRSLATSQRTVIASVVPTIARVLGSDFVGMLQRKMRDESYPKAAVQGALPPEHTIVAFLVLINNLDIATEYVERIVQSRLASGSAATNGTADISSITDLYPFNQDAAFVKTSLLNLQSSFQAKTSELISDGIFVVFKNVMKPRLRPILADTFRDIDYAMTEEELEELGKDAYDNGGGGSDDNNLSLVVEDAVKHRFQRGWDALTKPIARILTAANFDRLLSTIVSYLAEVLEKRIWSYYGRINTIGAVRLERDIAGIVSIVAQGGKYAMREAFMRCTQICLVMNMEDEEWDELLQESEGKSGDDGFDWKINVEERGRAKILVDGRL